MTAPRAGKRAGFSIVEVTLTCVLFVGLMGSIAMAADRAMKAFGQSSASGDVNARAARAIGRILQELRGARAGTLAPPPDAPFGSPSMEFEILANTAAGVPTWGARRAIALDQEPGELDNGLDDNGNGLIDERVVVLVEDPGGPSERRTIIVHGVAERLEGEVPDATDNNGNGLIDEDGLSFVKVDDLLTVRLTLQRAGPGGTVLSRTQEAGLVLRN